MIGYSKVNTKGQVTIPVDIRRDLAISPKDKVMVTKVGDGAVISKLGGFFDLMGSVEPKKKPEDFQDMRDEFKKYLSGRRK